MNVCGGWAYITDSKKRLAEILADLERKAAGRNFYVDNGRFAEDINHFRLYMEDFHHYEDGPWKIISILRKKLKTE